MPALQITPIRPAGLGRSPDPLSVAGVMARGITAISPDTPIHEAARLLREEGLPGLPVVDSTGCLVGVLGEHDLIARLAPRRRHRAHADGGTRGRAAGPNQEAFREIPPATVPTSRPAEITGTRSTSGITVGEVMRPASPGWRADADLVADMTERMEQEPWIPRVRPTVEARDGVLTLWGVVGCEPEKAALITMARAIPGCREIEDHLIALGPGYRYHEMV